MVSVHDTGGHRIFDETSPLFFLSTQDRPRDDIEQLKFRIQAIWDKLYLLNRTTCDCTSP